MIKLQNNVKSCSILKIKHKISVNTQLSPEACFVFTLILCFILRMEHDLTLFCSLILMLSYKVYGFCWAIIFYTSRRLNKIPDLIHYRENSFPDYQDSEQTTSPSFWYGWNRCDNWAVRNVWHINHQTNSHLGGCPRTILSEKLELKT